MNRAALIVTALLVAATTASATFVVINSNRPEHARMTEEQRLTRQTFFGSGDKLPPIEKGQEMRPRW